MSTRRAFVAAVILLMACLSDATGPVAGTLMVNLTTPNSGQDGAVMLLLTAPVVPTSASAAPGLTLWGGPPATTTAVLLVTGTLSTGTILTLQVEDVNRAGQYSVSIQQVAAHTAAGFVLRPLSGYSVTVTK